MPKRSSLTARERRFVIVYARTDNASQAFVEAGYPRKATHEQTGAAASRLRKRPLIAEAIALERQLFRERLEVLLYRAGLR